MGNNTTIKKNGKQTKKKQKQNKKPDKQLEGSTILYLQVLLKLHVHVVH